MLSRRLLLKTLLSLSLSCFLVSTSFSAAISHTAYTHKLLGQPAKAKLHWMPRLTGWGFWDVTNTEGLAKADLMIPFLTGNKMPFVDIQGKGYTAYDSWSGSLGVGYRQLLSNKRILGGYIFGDYNHFKNHHFWLLNPGVESLGCRWDFRGNLYIPLSDKKWVDEEHWDTSGDYIKFTNHEQYNRLYRMYHEIGYGVDGEIGRKIPKIKGLKAFLGGYYFDLSEDIVGIAGRLNYAINDHFAFDVRASYDDVEKGTLLAGIEVSLGGTHHTLRPTRMIQRMEDPIERQFGVLNNGTSVPVGKDNDYGQALERDHIWFFDADEEDDGAGTYEDPFQPSQYIQEKIDDIHDEDPDYAHLYFNKGIYAEGGEITLYNHQWMWGRTQDYTQAANQGARPVILGSLILPGCNRIDSLLFRNLAVDDEEVLTRSLTLGDFDTGITIEGNHVLLNHVGVGIFNNELGYRTGVEIKENVKDVTVKDSTIMGYHSGTPASSIEAIGIHLENGSEVFVEGSDIKAQAEAYEENEQEITVRNSNGGNGVAYGILADGQSNNITIKDSDIYASGTTSVGEHGGNAYGILIGKNYNDVALTISANTLFIEGSDIYAEGNGELGSIGGGNGTGVFIGAGFNEDSTLTISANNVTVKDSDLVGEGNSAVEDDGNGVVSAGNGIGLFIGMGYNNNGDMTISSNTLNIQRSDLIGTGNSITEGAVNGNESSNAGNGIGLFVGAEYNYKGDITISSNALNIQKSDLIGEGNSTANGAILSGNYLSNAGNGTGLFIGSWYNENFSISSFTFEVNISDNTLIIQNSDLVGIVNSLAEGENYGGNYYSNSGNGTGLFVGSVYNYNASNGALEVNISDNILTIQNSDLRGTGNTTARGYNGIEASIGNRESSSGNGTGLFVGSEYNYNYAGGNVEMNISDNMLTIQNSDLLGEGDSIAEGSDNSGNYRSSAGNGTGLFVGSGYNYNASDGTIDVDILNNVLIIQESDLVGTGNSTAEGGDYGNYYSGAGNGTGLLIGSGYNDNSLSGSVYMDISHNALTIQESDLIGTGNSTAEGGDYGNYYSGAGNGIGLFIGTGYNEGGTVTISDSMLTVQSSFLTGMGKTILSNDNQSAVGNGIGLLTSTVTMDDNTIDVEETEIYAKADDFSSNSLASGILIGGLATPTNNALTVLRSHFDIDGGDNAKEGYGIWMQGTGTLTRLLNTFLGVNVDNGKKVFAPSVTPSDTEDWSIP